MLSRVSAILHARIGRVAKPAGARQAGWALAAHVTDIPACAKPAASLSATISTPPRVLCIEMAYHKNTHGFIHVSSRAFLAKTT